jgi:hypothetical protein
MSGKVVSLPSRFPVGTKYVIEGRKGHIHLRYIEFPDGHKVDLPANLAARAKSRTEASKRRNPPRKRL